MTRVYPTAADHINKHPYQINYPSSYDPDPPTINDPNYGHYYVLEEDMALDSVVHGLFPIKDMIQMRFVGVSFQIMYHKDVLNIYHVCEHYIREIYDIIEDNPAVQTYVYNKFIPFYEEIEEHARRVLNVNPSWKEDYIRKNTGFLTAIHDILKMKGFTGEMQDAQDKIEQQHPLIGSSENTAVRKLLPEKLQQARQEASTAEPDAYENGNDLMSGFRDVYS